MANLTDLIPAVPTDPDDDGTDDDPSDDAETDPGAKTPSKKDPTTDPSAGGNDTQTPSGQNATKETPTDPPSTDDPTAPPKESDKAGSSANPTAKATEGTKPTPATTVDSADLTTPPSTESIFCAPLNTSAISVTYSNGTNVTLTAHAEGVLDITNDKNGSTIEVWDHDVGVDVNCTVVLPPKKEKKKKKPQEGTPTNTTVNGDGSANSPTESGANNGESIAVHLCSGFESAPLRVRRG
ncbi:hypothetical protein BCV69DRAFT_284699 [Microstroma glucosiphilum]|uniref:Uncharacterized protein n=1 Tax=Pseudomicrostroma glucosiphilum TaxID=1684307 RepID=A0A316U1J1_9BASI|nr:hypothetical protein BCV69DRAFT_284699 [Pseudomicrostroma glucosiphilum]PWN18718.1 hypothetical protein BCV69DRAFT_284699 [Pseudomicrostroma glucosiphilum]